MKITRNQEVKILGIIAQIMKQSGKISDNERRQEAREMRLRTAEMKLDNICDILELGRPSFSTFNQFCQIQFIGLKFLDLSEIKKEIKNRHQQECDENENISLESRNRRAGVVGIMKKLTNNQSRRVIVFIETKEEQKNALQLVNDNPDLFIGEDEVKEYDIMVSDLVDIIRNETSKVLFLRRGVNYTYSNSPMDLEVLR